MHGEGPVGDAWHSRPVAEIAARLETDPDRGLDPAEAERRLRLEGRNELGPPSVVSPLAIAARQFQSLVVWVLVAAALVSGWLGEILDSIAILAILAINALIGFVQELRAERAIAALSKLAAPRARVVRAGASVTIPAAEVVRGDLVVLESGDLVAADARLVDASSLSTNEAPLTGESVPVEKRTEPSPQDAPLAERQAVVFLGTSVARGSGRGIVVATGPRTEVGRIAALLETAGSGETPLQRRLDRVSRRLLVACSAIVAIVFGLGLIRAIPLHELFLTAVSLAVAAIPEGLPAVVAIALALGVSRMAKRNALVRHMPAVETLGSAGVICTDKTGTLTVGDMAVRAMRTADAQFTVTGEGRAIAGEFRRDGEPCRVDEEPELRRLLEAAAGCVEAEIVEADGKISVAGDPTEGALLVAAAKAGIRRPELEETMPRLHTIPFDSDRKRMTVVRDVEGEPVAFVKGAPEVILERCSEVRSRRGVESMSETMRETTAAEAARMANEALRVLAVAERSLDRGFRAGEVETDLVLLGLVGLQDPPRPEARGAVERCRRAGIRTVMITGDHPDTARAIAAELGILDSGARVLVGAELEHLDDDALRGIVAQVAVYARTTAEDKLRIVRAWKAEGAIVAMTGDGVNDAPALKEASIGVAMGRTGTEVAREAADMVITDDNFASIVAAVEEGRGIYDNIRKTLGYLLAGNAGELAVMLVAVMIGWPLPLLPVQLLWINLVTDGLPALALATDPVDPDVLKRPPRPADAQIIDREFVRRLAWTGALTAAVALSAFAYGLEVDGSVEEARSGAFSVLVIAELLRSFGARSPRRFVWEIGFFSNLRLFAIVAVSFALQMSIHAVPGLSRAFATTPVSAERALAWTGVAAVPLLVLEATKLRGRRA